MSNRTALVLALLIPFALAYDAFAQDSAGLIFAAGKVLDLLHWIAFWR